MSFSGLGRKQILSAQLKLAGSPLYLPALCFLGLLLAQVFLRTSAYSYATSTNCCGTFRMNRLADRHRMRATRDTRKRLDF